MQVVEHDHAYSPNILVPLSFVYDTEKQYDADCISYHTTCVVHNLEPCTKPTNIQTQ